MANIEIVKVETKKQLTKFIDLHYDLYEGNEYDAPNLFMDEWNTLSKDKNAAFEFCKAEYFLAYKDGKLVGRIAGIINSRSNETWNRKEVRFGWLDMIDDIEVTKALIKAVEDYGKENGMTHISGPMGFTDLDPEGMLTEGFDQLSTMATLYNYPYYPEHFREMNCWEIDNKYLENKLMVPTEVPERYAKVATMIEKRYNIHARCFTKKQIKKDKLGHKLFELINESYGHLYGYNKLSEKQIDQYVDMYLGFVDLQLVTGVFDDNTGELIGCGITMGSLTKALQKCKRGRLFPFGWWHLMMARYFNKTKIADLLLVAVKPEYRSKGANAVLFTDLIPKYIERGWEWGETHVEMETNEKVQSQWESLERHIHKRRICWIKEIGK